MTNRKFSLFLQHGAGKPEAAQVAVGKLIIAGWTGRNADAVEHHIRELEALGVKRPSSVPIFYRVSASRITTEPVMQVLGSRTSGEVEFVLLKTGGRLWVGTGSDHTDREAETYGVALSKQLCDKPVAPLFWAFDDVAQHWDRLVVRSFATAANRRELYQEGSVNAILPPEDLLARAGGIEDGTMMFCGTVAALAGVYPAERFDFELDDPVRGRKIAHGYDVNSLPVAG